MGELASRAKARGSAASRLACASPAEMIAAVVRDAREGGETTRAPLGSCPRIECLLHSGSRGCAMPAGVERSRLRAWLDGPGADGFGAQIGCRLHVILGRRVSALDEPATATVDRAGALWLRLDHVVERTRKEAVRLGDVMTALKHHSIDLARSAHGRPRCGTCEHYGVATSRCLRHPDLYREPLSPATDHRKLVPPCTSHAAKGRHVSPSPDLGLESFADDATSEERADDALLHAGLAELRHRSPGEAALLEARYLEQRSLRELSAATRLSVRRLERELERALELLRDILEDMP